MSRVPVALARIAEETRCPVCFGILKNTVASTVCLHRFCATCIETCLAGRPAQHKDCPVCRTNLHSRRALRPDPNFDRLLKALYGDVAAYEQQEDALVAARNAARAREMAEEAEMRRAQRAAQQAAAAAGRARHGLGTVSRAGSGSLNSLVREGSSNGSLVSNGGGKRTREVGGDVPAAAGAPAAKRNHTLPAAPPPPPQPQHHHQHQHHPRQSAAQPPHPSPPRAPHPACRAPRPASPSPAATPSRHASGRLPSTSPGPAFSPRRSPSPPPHASRQWRSPTPRGGAAAAVGSGGSGGGPPMGPLAVPTARSAGELSLRHPGMVVVQLQPAHSHGGSAFSGGVSAGSADGGGTRGTGCGRAQRDRTPALEKPFLLCPVGWTVAHIAQLLSQWLPRRGFGPAAAPVPPADIKLEPAPGSLRGSHRCLRGCTPLGPLVAELQGAAAGGGGGCRSDAHAHLVLLYSVMPTHP